jgi:hypothetical protein
MEFRELYYSRQADLYNTVYSCENMNKTLDRMLAVIEPEMPKQIERWGGTLAEWKANVKNLRAFVNKRCEYLSKGMTSCFDVSGPYNLTVDCKPKGIADMKINTIDVPDFPWTGKYFGGMSNNLQAFVKENKTDEYRFSHWQSKSGTIVSPDNQNSKIGIKLSKDDTLIAVFTLINSTEDTNLPFSYYNVHPNPTSDFIIIDYYLNDYENICFELFTILGEKVKNIEVEYSSKTAGKHSLTIDTKSQKIDAGIYFLKMRVNNLGKYRDFAKKIIITK